MNGRNLFWTILGVGAAVGATAYFNKNFRKMLVKTAGNAGSKARNGYEQAMHQITPGTKKQGKKPGRKKIARSATGQKSH